ncbi:MAG: hypothetical protein A2Z15_04230 [Chloroflexi bacterium RBG_16_50_11]|nr:MAG: hypothetical protein A2Z15_04230 [Chloroflexi bacterium RBG_16_50_11]
MGFFNNVFNYLCVIVFTLVGMTLIFTGVISCSFGGMFENSASPWVSFLIFFVPGVICLAIARLFGKRC